MGSRFARLLLFLFALLSMVAGLVACRTEHVPPLVEVTDMTPREAEVGDRLELRGNGFPQGRTARVTFKGRLHRAGERSAAGTDIDVDGVVLGTERIEVVLNEITVERFCGHGDRAAHTTFIGDVEVAFRSSIDGAPPLVGILRAVTFDVHPTQIPARVTEARAQEGARVLDFIGIVPGAATPRGLPIIEVKPSSAAARSLLRPGDVLTSVDGVRVAGVEDVLPASSRETTIRVRRGDSEAEESRTIPLVGYAAARIPLEYAPAMLLVALALAILLVLVAPGPRALGSFELMVTSRLRGASARSLAGHLFGRGPRAFAAVLASLVVATFALGPHVVAPELDGGLLLVVALALFGASRLGLARRNGALKSALMVIGASLLFGLAMLAAVFSAGTFALTELVRAQGAAPWEVGAVREPALACFAFAYLTTLVMLVRTGTTHPLGILERVSLVILGALAAAVFFGGWQLPGAEGTRVLGLQILGALLFVVKTWAIVAVVLGLRAIAGADRGAPHVFEIVAKRVVPALVVGVAIVILRRHFVPGRAMEIAWGALVVAGVGLFVMRSVLRVFHALRRPAPHVSPFL